jgi:hypothetical protein
MVSGDAHARRRPIRRRGRATSALKRSNAAPVIDKFSDCGGTNQAIGAAAPLNAPSEDPNSSISTSPSS